VSVAFIIVWSKETSLCKSSCSQLNLKLTYAIQENEYGLRKRRKVRSNCCKLERIYGERVDCCDIVVVDVVGALVVVVVDGPTASPFALFISSSFFFAISFSAPINSAGNCATPVATTCDASSTITHECGDEKIIC
jgi:hypothetical protein